MDKIQRRQLESLRYVTPEELGREVAPFVEVIIRNPEAVKHFSRKIGFLERYQAAQLAFMFKHGATSTADVTVCVLEKDDFDCVLKFIPESGEVVYKPVQLKQLPSHKLNANADIQAEINKLRRYGCSPDLLVAFWINRDVKFDLSRLDLNGLGIEQLWFLGDNPSGELTFHGGLVSDLRSGNCQVRVLRGAITENRRVSFIPKVTSD